MKQEFETRFIKMEEALGIQEDGEIMTGLKKQIETATKNMDESVNAKFEDLEQDLKDELETAEKWHTQIALKVLANDVHNRKWCLIIHGLKGEEGEKDTE